MIDKVLQEVKAERERQDSKWGVQDHSLYKWNTILMEEVGEACKESFNVENCLYPKEKEYSLEQYREEMIQVAAVAVAIIEMIDRNKGGK